MEGLLSTGPTPPIFFMGASWLRVFYQRGLPRLLFFLTFIFVSFLGMETLDDIVMLWI